MLKFSPYSYSKIDTFMQCPNKFKLNYIDKISVFNTNKALEKGTRVHEIIEFFEPTSYWKLGKFEYSLLEESEQLLVEQIGIDFCNSELGKKYLMHSGALGHELKIGLDTRLQICNYFDDKAMLRGKIDFAIKDGNKLIVVDWKTGKVKEQAYMSNDQVLLYAIWAFNMFPDVIEVQADYVYVEHNDFYSFNFKRDDYKNFTRNYASKIKAIETEEMFNKKTGPLCAYCDYFKQNYCTGKE